MDTPDHVALAEELGYRRAWLYDSPALYPEVFMTLARCAERALRNIMLAEAGAFARMDLLNPEVLRRAAGRLPNVNGQ